MLSLRSTICFINPQENEKIKALHVILEVHIRDALDIVKNGFDDCGRSDEEMKGYQIIAFQEVLKFLISQTTLNTLNNLTENEAEEEKKG